MLFLMGVLGMMAVGASFVLAEDEIEGDPSDPTEGGGAEGEVPPGGETVGTTFLAMIQSETEAEDQEEAEPEQGNAPVGDPNDPHWGIQEGTDGSDRIEGTLDDEFLIGGAGDDLITGGGGTDQVEGGSGQDHLSGGDDADQLDGQEGNDTLYGDSGDDTLAGHDGDDSLFGGLGQDSLVGGQGNDHADGGAGDDAVHGYHGDDTLFGGDGEDSLFGSLGNDHLNGGTAEEDDGARDYLNGGAGDDVIAAGAMDVVTGGEGADTIGFSASLGEGEAVEIMDFEEGSDNLVIVYEGEDAPQLDVEPDAENAELYRILADDQVIAKVHSEDGLTLQNIALVAQDAA